MKVVVVDVAAEYGGAATILHEFREAIDDNTEDDYCFLLSRLDVVPSACVASRVFPWVKKSWLHRLWFDFVVAPRVIRKLSPDVVLSLQNLVVPRVRAPQVVYLHQSLPFSEYRFSLFGAPKLWVYQNVIGALIRRSVLSACVVVTQTKWMREAVLDVSGREQTAIVTVPVATSISKSSPVFVPTAESLRVFFYPAGPQSYKNHRVLVEAADLLVAKGFRDFKIVLTVTPRELMKSAGVRRIPTCIETVGRLPHEDVLRLYAQSVLVFPSVLESSPLPPTEARSARSIILASDTVFNREVLHGYENGDFFPARSAESLAALMEDTLTRRLGYSDSLDNPEIASRGEDWAPIFNILKACSANR